MSGWRMRPSASARLPAARATFRSPGIMSAAQITNADAIHPGYGFLAENYQFAEAVESSGLTFIGPAPESIRMMGDKSVAKATMKRAGVPVLPGSDGIGGRRLPTALALAEKVGYPVILKAKDGGGGKGMRVVEEPADLERQYQMAQTEASAAFGSGALYLEKYLQAPRHVEIQLVGGHARPCRSPLREGLLHPAPPPEAAGGVPQPRPRPAHTRQPWGAWPARERGRSATAASAPWSSCSIRTAPTTSWR